MQEKKADFKTKDWCVRIPFPSYPVLISVSNKTKLKWSCYKRRKLSMCTD